MPIEQQEQKYPADLVACSVTGAEASVGQIAGGIDNSRQPKKVKSNVKCLTVSLSRALVSFKGRCRPECNRIILSCRISEY